MNSSISNICRCCMNNSNEMKSIFSEEEIIGTKKQISEMLMACASVNVSIEDGLPLNLCLCCITELNNAFIFKQRCERIDATLRESLNHQSVVANIGTELFETKLQNTEISQLETHDDSEYKYEILDEEFYDEEPSGNNEITVNENDLTDFNDNQSNNGCPHCHKEFSTKTSLRQHLKTHTQTYPCSVCNKTFKSSQGLWYHMKRHYNIKEYQCPVSLCKRKFTVKQALHKHFETFHTNEKKYLCPQCGKMYSTHDALSYHLKQHIGQRPYLCIHCGKAFKQSCHLKTHMWVHNGIKPYKCNHCGNCYTTGFQLKRHNIVHSKKSLIKSDKKLVS